MDHQPNFVTQHYECSCSSDEHTLKFSMDEEDGQVWGSVFLNDYRNVFQRLWVAVKYLFGYKCRYGHWDTFAMKREDRERLIALLNRSIEIDKKLQA